MVLNGKPTRGQMAIVVKKDGDQWNYHGDPGQPWVQKEIARHQKSGSAK